MPFDPATMWSLLMSGQIFQAILSSYTNVIGLWFYAIVLFTGMIMIYLKTESLSAVITVGTIITMTTIGSGIFASYLPPEIQNFTIFVIVVGITIVLYKIFH